MEAATEKCNDYSQYKRLDYWNIEDLINRLLWDSTDTHDFIEKAITRAIETGAITTYDWQKKNGEVRIKPLTGLNWAKSKGYSIPKALTFHQKDDGNGLAWGEAPKARPTYKWIQGNELLKRWQVSPTELINIGQKKIERFTDSGYNCSEFPDEIALLYPRRDPIDGESTYDLTQPEFIMGLFNKGSSGLDEIKKFYFSMEQIYEAEHEYPYLAEQAKKNRHMAECSKDTPFSRGERQELEQLKAEKEKTKNLTEKLTGKDAQAFGRLKSQKEKLESSIPEMVKAALEIGVKLESSNRQLFIKQQITDCINRDHPGLSTKIVDMIWKAIPAKYKNGAGAPSKSNHNDY